MFSGIVKGVGRILEQRNLGGDQRWVVAAGDAALGPLAVGGSIAVSGVCLTVTECTATASRSICPRKRWPCPTFGKLGVGARVNLEAPLTLADLLDGHLVTGHVDGVGEVVDLAPAARSTVIRIEIPEALSRYVAHKGSIAVDGVSLTVNAVQGRASKST